MASFPEEISGMSGDVRRNDHPAITEAWNVPERLAIAPVMEWSCTAVKVGSLHEGS